MSCYPRLDDDMVEFVVGSNVDTLYHPHIHLNYNVCKDAVIECAYVHLNPSILYGS